MGQPELKSPCRGCEDECDRNKCKKLDEFQTELFLAPPNYMGAVNLSGEYNFAQPMRRRCPSV
jgi:hypothetical protein